MIRKEEITPRYTSTSVEQLTPEYVATLDVKAIGFDVDGTLSDYHSPDLELSIVRTLYNLATAGFYLCVVSNAYGERVQQLRGHTFKGVLHPDQIITPVNVTPFDENPSKYKKPNPAMILRAADVAGVDTSELLIVGDQILKDILSANRAGARSLLVPRRGTSDHLGVRLLQRPIETVVRKALGITFPVT